MNEWYFATEATANTLCKRLMCLFVLEKPSAAAGGPYTVSALERWLVFSGGLQENAGILASFYTRNPEDQFPGLADKFVAAQLAQDRK